MILNLFYMIAIRSPVECASSHEEDNTGTDYRYLCYDSRIATQGETPTNIINSLKVRWRVLPERNSFRLRDDGLRKQPQDI